eukprot:GHVT01090882.1.p1 GENE.GHVT01090882.1~~GHVT01090882.1.p1  ORF type:complete len:133 (-),score=15.18 GHVT01090882.1:198-596(-)
MVAVSKVKKTKKMTGPKKVKKVKKTTKPLVKKVKKVKKGRKIIGTRRSVMSGKMIKTSGGLTKTDMMKSKSGKYVSKKKHAQGKRVFRNIKTWNEAVQKARKALGIKGFCAVGGKSVTGQKLLSTARSFYKK